MGRNEDEFYKSSVGKIIKLINIYEGNSDKKESSIDDLPVSQSMKDIS